MRPIKELSVLRASKVFRIHAITFRLRMLLINENFKSQRWFDLRFLQLLLSNSEGFLFLLIPSLSSWPQCSYWCPRVIVASTQGFGPLSLLAAKFNWFNFLKAFPIIPHTPTCPLILVQARSCLFPNGSPYRHQFISLFVLPNCLPRTTASLSHFLPSKNIQVSIMPYKQHNLKFIPLSHDFKYSMLCVILS